MSWTVDVLKTNVANTFPRQCASIPAWSLYFDTNLESWLYELCDFPYWFLTQTPSPIFTSQFPITDYTSLVMPYGQWAANGWLILQAGISNYSLAAPFEVDQEDHATWWSIMRAAGIEAAKLHDDNGKHLQDLEVLPANAFHDIYASAGGNGGGQPRYITLRTTEIGSSIMLWPRPSRPYPLAISWTLRESPIYINPTDGLRYSKFLTWAQTAVFYKCLYHAADFFDEDGMMQKFSMQLYGTPAIPKMDTTAMTLVGGIMGRLKEETRQQSSQREQQAKFWPSCARATGRRDPYSGRRALPWGYGYLL